MKKLFVVFAMCSFAFCEEELVMEEAPQDEIVLLDMNMAHPTPPSKIQTSPTKTRSHFNYVRLGPSNNSFTKEIFPSISLGRRYEIAKSAIDLSAGFGYLGKTYSNSHAYYAYLPKIMYLRYTSQEKEASFFYGSGLSFFGSSSYERSSEFFGIATHISAGFEFGRKDRIRQLMQFDVSQPILPAYNKANFPLPIIEFSAGVGF